MSVQHTYCHITLQYIITSPCINQVRRGISRKLHRPGLAARKKAGCDSWLDRHGAEYEARTRDPHLGKVVLYH